MTDQLDAPTEPSTAAEEAPSTRRNTIKAVGIGVLALGVAYGAYAFVDYRAHGRFVQTTEDAYVRADGVTISSKLAGYVRAVNVRDNQSVEKGALLVEVDPTDYQTRLSEAEAQVQVAQATQSATAAGIGEAQAGVGQAQAALAAAQRDLAYLNGEVARYRPLVATGAEPKQALDQMIANRDKAAAQARAQAAALAAAQSKVASVRAQVGQSAAQIEAARAQQQAARNDLGTTRIAAPVGGKVGNSSVRLGQFVQPGQRLLTIVPVDALYVEANFKETQIGLMRPGQPVIIEADALSGVEFHGHVESITPGTGANFSLIPPQNATGNFTKIVQRVPVRIRIDAGPESRKVLVPGLSLSVKVDTSSARQDIDVIRDEQDRMQQDRAGR